MSMPSCSQLYGSVLKRIHNPMYASVELLDTFNAISDVWYALEWYTIKIRYWPCDGITPEINLRKVSSRYHVPPCSATNRAQSTGSKCLEYSTPPPPPLLPRSSTPALRLASGTSDGLQDTHPVSPHTPGDERVKEKEDAPPMRTLKRQRRPRERTHQPHTPLVRERVVEHDRAAARFGVYELV